MKWSGDRCKGANEIDSKCYVCDVGLGSQCVERQEGPAKVRHGAIPKWAHSSRKG